MGMVKTVALILRERKPEGSGKREGVVGPVLSTCRTGIGLKGEGIENVGLSQLCWHMLVLSALRRLRQNDQKF